MVPLRFVFRSRWWALAWAAGICWSAISFVGGQADNKQTDAKPVAQSNELDALLNGLM